MNRNLFVVGFVGLMSAGCSGLDAGMYRGNFLGVATTTTMRDGTSEPEPTSLSITTGERTDLRLLLSVAASGVQCDLAANRQLSRESGNSMGSAELLELPKSCTGGLQSLTINSGAITLSGNHASLVLDGVYFSAIDVGYRNVRIVFSGTR